MKAPSRTIRRESSLSHRGRKIVLKVAPVCDLLIVRHKGRRTEYLIDIASVFDLACKKAALAAKAAKLAKKRAKAGLKPLKRKRK